MATLPVPMALQKTQKLDLFRGQGGEGNAPDRLVGNDDLGPFFLAQDLGDGTELSGDDLDGLFGLTLLYDISSVLIV